MAILNWLRKLWFKLFPKAEINHVNTKLQKAIIKKQVNQVTIIKEVRDYMVNVLKIDSKSKFIPLSLRQQACVKVNKEFGERMKACNVILTINMQLVAR